MKNLKSILYPAALLAIFSFASCDSDDDNDNNGSNFLSSYLSQTGFDEANESVVDDGPYEFGVLFHVTADGNMETIRVKIPQTTSDLRITVWNVDTATPIRTETVDVTADESKTLNIDDLALTANTDYAITMNADSYYYHDQEDGGVANYPITVGDVVIDGYAFASGTDQLLPLNMATDYYAGDLSFTFDAD